MKHICCYSGGKDSGASIILAHENNEPLDVIVFSEVMFDKKNNISGENPKHIDFILNKAKPLFESWGYEFIVLHADKDYLDCFYHVIEKPKKHMEHKGMRNGFSPFGMCNVKRDCKLKPIEEWKKTIKEPYMQYVGIGIDEHKRLESLHKDKTQISLLEKYNYTTEMAKEKCLEYGLLSPAYDFSKRGGCWFCPNAKLLEHELLRNADRKTWDRFVALENETNIVNYKWNIYGDTLKERDEQLEWKSRQITIFDLIS